MVGIPNIQLPFIITTPTIGCMRAILLECLPQNSYAKGLRISKIQILITSKKPIVKIIIKRNGGRATLLECLPQNSYAKGLRISKFKY